MQFNLLESGFITVLKSDGTFDRIGIRVALNEAGRIRNSPGPEEQTQHGATDQFTAGRFAKLRERAASGME